MHNTFAHIFYKIDKEEHTGLSSICKEYQSLPYSCTGNLIHTHFNPVLWTFVWFFTVYITSVCITFNYWNVV